MASPSRIKQVVAILDAAIGGPDATFAFHGPFWIGLTRDAFVAMEVFGLPVVVVGDGPSSNLVRALKGEAPFGVDLPEPPPGSQFGRMPSGLPPVAADDIAIIERWIDDGCPDDSAPPSPKRWRPTNAPVASSRTDDIWFRDASLGWAVNSNGQILRTTDGGSTWQEQLHDPAVYFRCIGFASDEVGWVGTLSPQKRLFATRNGGATWDVVPQLPDAAPSAMCGLAVVDESVVYGAGTNQPSRPARMVKTVDGGQTWTAWDMGAHATLLVDTFFTSPEEGWVVGGFSSAPRPSRADVRAVVLHTGDGGQTWVNRVADLGDSLPLGEWGWKIHFVDQRTGFVSLESFERGAVLKTTDGGQSWERLVVGDPQGNVNLEGVGFVDDRHGWVGGWGSADFTAGSSSETTDGGQTWNDANDIGRFLNRFRFVGAPVEVGYASGRTVYKYSEEAVLAPPRDVAVITRLLGAEAPLRGELPVALAVTVPAGAGCLTVDIWDRFGDHVGRIVDERDPAAGPRTLGWDGTDAAGRPCPGRSFIVRVTVDQRSESQLLVFTP